MDGDWAVRMIDGMGLRVDMHGWSERSVVIQGNQTETANSAYEQSSISRPLPGLRSAHLRGFDKT